MHKTILSRIEPILIAATVAAGTAGCGISLPRIVLTLTDITFFTGCPWPFDVPPIPSGLFGTWEGTVTVDQETTTRDGLDDEPTTTSTTGERQITVTFDLFGRPVGNDDPWPAEWPGCFHAGATLEREWIGYEAYREDTKIRITEAAFTPESLHLVWSRNTTRANGFESENRTYDATLQGDVLNWSAQLSGYRGPWQGSTGTHMTGQLRRIGQ